MVMKKFIYVTQRETVFLELVKVEWKEKQKIGKEKRDSKQEGKWSKWRTTEKPKEIGSPSRKM